MSSSVTVAINDKVSVTAEGQTVKEIFDNLALLTETFGEEKCGCCGSKRLKFRVRKVNSDGEKFEFPELVCQDCFAKLAYGISQEITGFVYPKRIVTGKRGKPVKDENGKVQYLPNNGWSKWEKKDDAS